jgi:hypothetical protein
MASSLFVPKEAKAVCYYQDNPGYGACLGWASAKRCQDGGVFYACCNQASDVCPPLQTNPGETPQPPDPGTDPNCGGISQPCCSGNTCDSGDLTCTTISAGNRCLTEAQVGQMGGAQNNVDVFCGSDKTGINTAIGCIHLLGTPGAFFTDLLRWATGIGSGIAFLLMLYAGFILMTASGNPERIKAGQELMTSAIAGLAMIILSIFVLKFIGVDILGLCNFGFGNCPT